MLGAASGYTGKLFPVSKDSTATTAPSTPAETALDKAKARAMNVKTQAGQETRAMGIESAVETKINQQIEGFRTRAMDLLDPTKPLDINSINILQNDIETSIKTLTPTEKRYAKGFAKELLKRFESEMSIKQNNFVRDFYTSADINEIVTDLSTKPSFFDKSPEYIKSVAMIVIEIDKNKLLTTIGGQTLITEIIKQVGVRINKLFI
jgi:hypothetical protein